ncbi:cobaltochelatase subunit CobN [Paludibacterium yongneupense]|uniref:cobaltochelatase subunit CobN n=1 Tax=Paludibacterium yongneupense TaxID=400061 RepID=UPI0004914D79|nr:cobaltochelatase subunit CobN [Paludibacterium yongneupense]
MSRPLPGIALFSHAATDLSTLARARAALPPDFGPVIGINLQTIADADAMERLCADDLTGVGVLVVRLLGRHSSVPGFDALLRDAARRQRALIVVSGTGEPDPELAALSSVPPQLQHDVTAYLQAGGGANLAALLRCLADRLLMTGFGYPPPQALPEHGIYHPELPTPCTLADWSLHANPDWPTVGIAFYRAHWLSGNTHFIDQLIDSLARRQLNALPVFTASLRRPGEDGHAAALDLFADAIDVLINTTAFAMGDIKPDGPTQAAWSVSELERCGWPVIQAMTSSMTSAQWRQSERGLNPLDTAMNVALPEFDGRIISVPISFRHADDASLYAPLPDRVERVAGLAARLVRLRRTPRADKRIAFIFTNSSSKASQIGNAVGLDSPASLLAVLHAMQAQGYAIDGLPESSDALIHALIDRGAYDQAYLRADQLERAIATVPAARYAEWFSQLPHATRAKMQERWGEAPGNAYVHDGKLVFAGLSYGNAFVALQPPRGYGMDPDAIYHTPDLAPTHHYYALYRWLRDEWQADAIVHVGKHGTLEWLPGKGVGLSDTCFPDALLGDMPLFYPFILNDPGEGAQAKRRAHAVVIDHLTPPMTTADTYGPLAQLTQLVDEYYQVEMLDPAKLPLLQQQIWDLIKEARLDTDLAAMRGHDHHDPARAPARGGYRVHAARNERMRPAAVGYRKAERLHDHAHGHEHAHEWDATPGADGVPLTLSKMEGVDIAHLVEDIDGYLCELGAAQIRDGLHILGRVPEGDAQIDMLCALLRLPNLDVPSLPAAVSAALGGSLDAWQHDKGKRLDVVPSALAAHCPPPLVTRADALDAVAAVCRRLVCALADRGFAPTAPPAALAAVLPGMNDAAILSALDFACTGLVPRLARTRDEIGNLLLGLDGGYVPAGPSGAPTRGMAHILPTGRNFYSVDPRCLPSQAAWRIGSALAHEVIARHRHETGRDPESVSISVWGTSAMRTHGDDIAQILALIGARPRWQPENRGVCGIEVIPLAELGHPRIDVTVRISGFFRDAFPHLIDLLDQAVHAVAHLDEPPEQNYLRKHYLADLARSAADTLPAAEAEARALYRVFGSKPGTYGAGILPLINEQNWSDDADFATAYINWGGYAYSRAVSGVDARDDFRHRLSGVEVALHNQDNREHDIFDSDDYLQYHGGMIATIRSLTGRQPRHYFGDSHDPEAPAVRGLKEEVLRVFRSRVANPKWLAGIRQHGYKGCLELTATVDYLFGYDATAHVVDDWVYRQLAETYALAPDMQAFFAASNPWALNAITERLLEAAQRQLWAEPDAAILAALRELYLKSESWLEARGDMPPRGVQTS